MRQNRSRGGLALVALGLLVACNLGQGGATPTTADLTASDQSAIYAAVVRQLYSIDHTFAQPPQFPVIYLVRRTDDGSGVVQMPTAEPRILPESVQAGMVALLSDLPAEFKWVESEDEVPKEAPGDRVAGGGAIITLGNIHRQAGATMLVPAELYVANLAGTGRAYLLQQQEGTWRITGEAGPGWISQVEANRESA